ncbi:MAG TPA: hypothetical protein VM070_04375 [Candidatus Saccharimonadales bacterium]|nr:hypothetical protein [Candidatus Saccharimonadales bacterium]
MEWFEELTGISPDGGSGSFEALLASLIGVGIIAAVGIVMRRRAATRLR